MVYGSVDNAEKPEAEPSHPPFSLAWFLNHGINYQLGGVYFVFGTLMYYPAFSSYTIGALLYSIGSFHFLVADACEWWAYKHACVGGCLGKSGKDEDEAPLVSEKDKKSIASVTVWWDDAALPTNLFCSTTGSFLYLVGSIGFFPQLDVITVGYWGFIIGSLVIFLSQVWKVVRIGCTNSSPQDLTFRVENFQLDGYTAVVLEATAGLGGLCFFVGTIMYLPQFSTSSDTDLIVNIWMVGSAFFTVSGIALLYRHLGLSI